MNNFVPLKVDFFNVGPARVELFFDHFLWPLFFRLESIYTLLQLMDTVDYMLKLLVKLLV